MDQLYNIIDAYNNNPNMFSDQEVAQLAEMAAMSGINFKPQNSGTRALKNFGFNMLDTALFGLLPDDMGPYQLSGADKVGAGLGNIAGFFTTPMAAGRAVATKGMDALGKAAKATGPGAMQRGAQALENRALQAVGGATRPRRAATGRFQSTANPAAADVLGVSQPIVRGAGYADGVGRGVAQMITGNPMASRAAQGAMTYGTASAAAGVFENDLATSINNALGGAGMGAIGGLLAQTGGNAKPIAAMIYAGMTGPDKEMYPQEAIEDFILKVASVYGR
jgi:hypothetical protein